MRCRTQVCAWIAAFGLTLPAAAAGQDRTARDLVDQVVREGPQARAIRAGSEVTRWEQAARLVHANPELSYSREGAGFTEILHVEQPIQIFGVRAALSRAGVAATAAAEADRDARLWMVRSDAANAVARLAADERRLAIVESHAREVERLITILRAREDAGEGSRFDRVRAELELREARRAVTEAAVALTVTRSALEAMLPPRIPVGRILEDSLALEPPPGVDVLVARAASSRAELRALQLGADRADREAVLAQRSRLPAPTIVGGLKRADAQSRRESGGMFGVNLSLPLFNRGGREAAPWIAERLRVEAEHAAIEAQIRAEVAAASEGLVWRMRAFGEDETPVADDLMQIAEIAYREGEVGILELLDAARTASRSRIRSIDVRLEARLAQIALERAVGEVLWP